MDTALRNRIDVIIGLLLLNSVLLLYLIRPEVGGAAFLAILAGIVVWTFSE